MAFNCKISTGFTNDCSLSMGGVRRLAIANWSNKIDITGSTGTCEADTINFNDSEEHFYELQTLENTASATAEMVVGDSSDRKYINHIVAGTIARLNCDFIDQFKEFLLAKVIFAVETKNGEVFIFGKENGMVADTFSYQTGAADGDASGISFQFSGGSTEPPIKVNEWKTVSDLFPTE